MEFEIIDSAGVIHSGTEEEMREAFAAMTGDRDYFTSKKAMKNAQKMYCTQNDVAEWSGDLKMVHVIALAK